MKQVGEFLAGSRPRRPPRGGRGLKPNPTHRAVIPPTSPPARGAWIETSPRARTRTRTKVAPRAGGVD